MASADWALPILTSLYTDVLDLLKSRDEDAAIMFDETASASAASKPDRTMRFNRTLAVFQEWRTAGAVWTTKLLGVAGGGTGAASAVDARTNLGLGTMATQSSSAVAITGGTLTGVSVELAAAGTGLAVQTDNTVDVGTVAKLLRAIYSKVHFADTARWSAGNGSPEGVLAAPVGSLYSRLDGGANTTLYVKESGAGNAGWVAK